MFQTSEFSSRQIYYESKITCQASDNRNKQIIALSMEMKSFYGLAARGKAIYGLFDKMWPNL